jgi:hypothetical protein
MKYYIITTSKDHVLKGISGGFCQACHGKKFPMEKLKKEDWIIFYSPKIKFNENNEANKLKKFTAIGQVIDDKIYQIEQVPDFIPWRRNINFILNINEVNLSDLKCKLNYILFRYGFFEISYEQFIEIKTKMLKE